MRGRQIIFLSLFITTIVAVAGIPPKSQFYEVNAVPNPNLIAGRNVNMVSGMTLPDGDPWLQRQNEPSIAVSTRNPLHLLAGANDYRTVDIPGLNTDQLPGQIQNQSAGDAWLGVFKSFDGGQSWISTLLPNYPQDPNIGPLSGYQAAADPVVRAGAHGLFYYSGIVFNRDAPGNSAVFVARFIDNNNDEEGDPIQHIDTIIVDELNGGRFKDKPWIAVGLPKKNAKSINIEGQSIPRSNVYIVYSVFEETEGVLKSKIVFRRSTDCGTTWEDPIELSLGHHLNQGAAIAVDPRDNGHIFVTWRRFDSGVGQTVQTDAIIVARSTNEGKEFTNIIEVANIPGPFDQPTSSAGIPLPGTAFRTNSYPTMAIDNKGRIYIAWSQRGVDPVYPNDCRILIATSKDGFVWTTPMTVESPVQSASNSDCHEFMPSMAFAGGRLILAWYDSRNDYCPEISPFYICDSGTVRHTVDVRVAQGQPGEFPVFQPSVQVSRYLWALWGDSPGNYYFSQVQFNPPNYPLFKGGTVPFHGDYIEIAPSPPLIQTEKGVWRYNTEPTDSQQFHLAWTDNRDVRPPADNNWTIYNPPTVSQSLSQSLFSVSTPCADAERTGMRNQNVYTSIITTEIEAGSPGNNKPLGTLGTNPATGEMIPRAFVIFVKNTTGEIRSYRLEITDGPDHGTASFLEFDILDKIDVSIAPYSSISRPLFVTSTDENDSVTVEVFEIDEPGGYPVEGGARSTIVINPDETSPDITGDLATVETHEPDIANPNIVNWTYVNPNIVNPNIVNPNIVNPNIVNPNIVNPNIVNPNIVNPNIVNLNIFNPNIVNPNIVNPNIVNPNIVNTSIADADVTDIEWPVTNAGNTVSSYTFKIFARESLPKGIYAQLLVYKVHSVPATDGLSCALQQTPHHELLLNVVNPNIVNPNIVNPNIVNPNIVNAAIENATFFLSPGDEALAVLRLIDPDPGVTKFLQSGRKFKIQTFAESLGAAAGAQAVDSDDALQGDMTGEADSTELIIITSGLPDGTEGEIYPSVEVPYVKLEASGGDGTYVWSVNSEQLPPGLGFTNEGIISGIPQNDPNVTYPHVYSFLVQVTSGGDFDTQNLSITINSAGEPSPPLNIETTSLNAGTLGQYYGATLVATGGVAPRIWSVASGSLPKGLTLDPGGVISGTIVTDDMVSEYPFTYSFVVQVADADQDTNTQSLSILVNDFVYPDLTISGTITNEYGSAVSGVSIYGLPHAPKTDSYGYYSDTVPYGWSGTITPFKAGYTFYVSTMDPSPSRTYAEITTDQLSQDFVANTINYTISGTVTFQGSPLAGVTMNGLPGTPVTNASGYYSAPVPHGWSGTVTPELLDYIFDPPNRTYASITSDYVLQNFAATFVGVGQDDPYEENDDLNSATDLTAGTYTNMQLHDDDWYRVDVAQGNDLKVVVEGDLSNDIDLELYDSLGDRIIGAYGSPQNATAYASDLPAGWCYFRVVYLGTTGFWNSYDLTIETGSGLGNGGITGRVFNSLDEGLEDVEITLFDTQSDNYFATTTNDTGNYSISLPPSFYKLYFDASAIGPPSYVSEYYDNRLAFENADEIDVQAGMVILEMDAVLELESVLSIVTSTLPDANLATFYSATLEAAGGTTPYFWDLDVGSSLPDGLTLHSDGQIDGIPTTLGTFPFTVKVTDSSPQTVIKLLSITINTYAGTDYVISGTVTLGSSPLEGVVMSGFPGNPVTNILGQYTAYVYSGWSGTVTPILAGYAFDPASSTYNDVTANIPGENYTALTGYVISGEVTLDGSPLGGVLMGGLPGNPITDVNGQYSGTVPSGWTGTVTPTLPGFDFTPEFTNYSTPVTSNQLDQDYTVIYVGGQDDVFEENDDFASAAEVPLGTHTNLVLLDEDWFKVYVSAADVGKDLKVHIKGTSYPNPNDRRDLDFFVLNSAEKLLSLNYCGSDDEIIFLTEVTEGWYYIGQRYISQTGTVYSMTVEVSDNFGIGYISGRVTDEKSGQGIERVYVELNAQYFDYNVSHPLITTDANGYYKIGYLPGNYRVLFNVLNLHHRDPWAPDVNYIGETYNINEIVPIVADTTVLDINAELIPGGTITGRVTDPDGNGLWMAGVYIYASDTSLVSLAYSDANGYYSAERMRTGNYKLRFSGGYGSNYGSVWYTDAGSFDKGHPVAVREGATTPDVDTQLIESGSIEGRVTDSDGSPLQGVSVAAYDVSGILLTGVNTDDNGEYRINNRLPEGDVVLFFDASSLQGNYVSEYYTDKFLLEEADPITVQSGQTTYGIDAVLTEGGTVSGRVTDGQGNGIQDVVVNCVDTGSDRNHYATPDADGNYAISKLFPGNYKVRFRPLSGDYALEWYNNQNSYASGGIVSVAAGQTTQGINAQLESNAGSIAGRVTDLSGLGIEGVFVWATDSTKEVMLAYPAGTDSQGFYRIENMPTGDVKIQFDADYRYRYYIPFVSEYYNDKSAFGNADPVTTTLGQTTPGINAVLAPLPPVNITTTSLSNGEVAAPYEVALEATGGREFYFWSLISGSLPQGLMLNSRGEITGTPMATGTYNFTVRVTDSSRDPQLIDTQTLSITIDAYAGTGYLISGAVTSGGSPLGGVVLQGLPGNPATNSSGEYTAYVYSGWSGTVTPILPGYAFDPASRTYNNVAANISGENYAASTGYVITGQVTLGGSPLGGVVVSGLPANPYTDVNGQYSGAVPSGWSGTVTPTLPGFSFTPPNISYSGVAADHTGQNYTANFQGGQDDAYEENDDVSDAAELTLGTHTNLVLSDADWFRVYVGAGDAGKDLKVNIKGTSYPDPNGNEDLDFIVLDGSEKMLGIVISSSDDETLYITDISEGWYYIGQTYIGQVGTVYSITLEVSDNFGIGYISGRVIDEQTGQGIEGIYVELYGDPFDWGNPRPLITTDANGEYKVGYTPGNYTVRFNLFNNYHRDDMFPDVNYVGETYNSNEIVPIVAGSTITGIDDQLRPGGTITGRITDPDGNGLNNGIALVYSSDTTRISYAWTDANGYYTAERIPTGNYKVRARADADGSMWYDEMGSLEGGHPVPVTAGMTTPNIDLQLEESAIIEGRVTDSGQNPIQDVTVTAYDVSGISLFASGWTNDNGEYRISRRLPTGDVIIFFDARNAPGNYASEYYTDKLLIEEADPVSVQAGQTTFGIDAELVEGGTITGRVTDAQGNGFSGVGVACFDADSERYHAATSDENGNYTLPNLPPDGYYVRFRTGIGTYAMEWYDDKGSSADGKVISVGTGQTISGIDAQLSDNGGFVSGRVEDSYGNGIADVYVWVQDIMEGSVYSSVFTDADGYYTAPRIPTCNAKVFFNSDYGYLNYVAEYYNDKSTYESADLVAATLGLETPGINAGLAPIPPINITITSLPNGEVADPYEVTLEVTGGREFYHWSLISGTLPPGLALNSKGEIMGTPTATGTSNFTVRVTDSSRNQQLIDTQTLSITIDTYQGTGYLISGSVLFGGSPLGGVVLQGLPGDPVTSSNGEYIVAVPQGWSGTVTPTLTGYYFDPASREYTNIDSNLSEQDYAAYELTLNITTEWLLNGTEGVPYNQTLGAEGGTEPCTWSLAPGSAPLPYGLSLDSNGTISGTPTQSDNYDITVRVTDSGSPAQSVQKELSLFIHGAGNVSETPVLYWKFNEGSGNTAYDSSGREINGDLYQNAVFTSDSLEGTAVETFGLGWIVTGGFFIADEATISAYVKTADNTQDRFIWKLQYESPYLGWPNSLEVSLEIREGKLTLFVQNRLFDVDNPRYEFDVDLSNPANGFILGDYNQIAVTLKDDQYKIYINGSEKASAQIDMFEIHDNVQTFWVMGADWADCFLEGQIDELSVYNRLLSPQEVTEYYTAGPMPTISGTIHLNGSPLPWVWMEGLNSSTNENGEYIAPVLPDWSGTVTPSHGGYYFDPPSRTYTNVAEDISGEDYQAFEGGSLWIETNWLPDGAKNQSYSTTLVAADGIEPYSWSLVSGSLPDGLMLDTNGEINGTPTEAGNFSFTVQVTDSNSPQQAATQWLSLYISAAHQGFWTTTYPFGGNMYAEGLAIDPNDSDVLFATAENRGIFHSIDAGSSWVNLIDDPGWPYGETDYQIFTIHRTSGNYYMCPGGRIYRSIDSGATWEQIYEKDDWDISTLTVDPTSASVIYVGTWDGEMHKTIDGGANWSAAGSGLPEEEITVITVDLNTPSTVFAGTNNSGIFKSINGGTSWSIKNGLIQFSWIEDIEIDLNSNIYVIAWTHNDGGGIYKSSDGGASWTKQTVAEPGWSPGNCIAIDPNNANIVYVASQQTVLKTTDGGNNWTTHSVSSVQTESIVIHPAISQILYAGTQGEGVYKSADGGVNWNPANNGIRALTHPGGTPHSLEIDESIPNYIYAGSIGGGYRSLDGGATWGKMDFPQWSTTAIKTHSSTAGTVYAVHNSFWKRSFDVQNGTWLDPEWLDPTNGSFCCVSRMDFGIASDNPNIIYLGARYSNDPQPGVYRSDDGGATWVLKNNGFTYTNIHNLVVHPTNHQVVFAGTDTEWPYDPDKDYGLYKTVDGGENWTHISSGKTDMHVSQIVIYPSNPDIMYLIGWGEETCGLFKSEDGGDNWWRASNFCGNSIAVSPNNPELVYMGSWDGVYVSLNGGGSWLEFRDGLPRDPQVDVIHLDPMDPFHVFIMTGAGVYEATFSFDFMIVTEELPSGVVAEPYSVMIEAAGGTPPITWELVSGPLPDGLSLNETTGEISGTPLSAGYWDITIKATDNSGNSYTRQYGLSIHNTFVLTVGTNPEGIGSVSVDPDAEKHIEGSMVDVSVTVPQGYIFTGWSGDATGTATLVHVEMTRDKALTANFALPADLPDYAIDSFSGPSNANAGDTIGGSVSAMIENLGADDSYTEDILVGIYLSSDPVIATSDILLWHGRSSIAALNGGATASVSISLALQIPTTISAGLYYIGILVDESDVIAEREETNNYSSQPISISTTAYDGLELAGIWYGGESNAVFCDEARDLAFVNHGAFFIALDVSDPFHPTKIGEVALGIKVITDIKVSGNYAYVTGDGLRVVDITDPTNPTEVGSNDSPYQARGLVVSGNYAYVTDHFFQGLRVFDISNPTVPTEVNFTPFPGRTRGIARSGSYLYLQAGVWLEEGETGVRIVDITNPSSPSQVNFYATEGGTGWHEVAGNYLYLPTNSEGLVVLDITDPQNPTQAAVYDGLGTSGWVKVVGNYAYITDNDRNAVVILNISDVNNIHEVGVHYFEDQNSINSMDVLGNHCYANGFHHSLKILDMSDPQNPYELGSFDEYEGILRDVDISEGNAYMTSYKSNGDSRMRTLGISTLPNIQEVGIFNYPNFITLVRVSGNFAYVVTGDEEIKVVDISNPSNPHEVGEISGFDNVYDLEVSGNYAFVADYHRGLEIFDISTPSNPVHVSTWYTPTRTYGVSISGNYAYVGALWGGLRIIDISDPMNPWEVGAYEADGFRAYELEASGNYVYVEDWDDNLRIIDVADKENPAEMGIFVTNTTSIMDIEVSGHIVFTGSYVNGMMVIDVSEPSNPVKLDEFPTFSVQAIAVKENYIYEIDRGTGLLVYEFRRQ